jgi:hypothetical protein
MVVAPIAVTKLSFTSLAALFAAMSSMFMLASPSEYVATTSLALSCGLVTVPLFFVFLGFEIYYIFIRPRTMVRFRGLETEQQQQPRATGEGGDDVKTAT